MGGWVHRPHPNPGFKVGKHARGVFIGDDLYIGGGDRDGSDGGQPSVWRFKVGDPSMELVSPMCIPAPDLMPAFPDNCTWVADPRRKRINMMSGFWFGVARAKAVCGRDDAGVLIGAINFDITNRKWAAPGWPVPANGYGGDNGSNFGVGDEPTDTVRRLFHDGAWGNDLQTLYRGTNTWEFKNLGPGMGTPLAGIIRDFDGHSRQQAVDPGKALYCVGKSSRDGVWYLLRVSLEYDPASNIPVQLIPMPPEFVPPNIAPGDGTDTLLVFDERRRLLYHPMMVNLGGLITGLLVNHVDDGHRWEFVPVPTGAPLVVGNLAACHPDHGLVLMGGHSVTNSHPSPTVYWTFTPEEVPTVRTATFNIDMSGSIATPDNNPPTDVRARAKPGPGVGGAERGNVIPWNANNATEAITLQFNENGESGPWDGFVDLLQGNTVLRTIGPVGFIIQGGTPVTFRAPAGFTVTVV